MLTPPCRVHEAGCRITNGRLGHSFLGEEPWATVIRPAEAACCVGEERGLNFELGLYILHQATHIPPCTKIL